MPTEKSLSDFWRHDSSDDRVMELISVLQGADNLVGLMGSDIRVTWSGSEVSYTDFKRNIVALDYGPLMGKGTPFAGAKVDEVIGYAAHEGGHCLWSAPDKQHSIYQDIQLLWKTLPKALKRAWNEGHINEVPDGDGGTINPMLIELCRIQNILEDAYIDHRVAKQWEVLGEHIHISRQKLQERRPFDFEAIARQRTPDRNDVLNLWIAVALYDTALPKRMSAKVKRAMTGLLELTSRAIGQHNGRARHGMAVDAAAILWQEFPVFQTPPEAQDQGPTGIPVSGAGGGAGGSGEKAEPGDGAGGGAGGGSGEKAEEADDADGGGGEESEEESLGKRLVAILKKAAEAAAAADSSPGDGDDGDDGDEGDADAEDDEDADAEDGDAEGEEDAEDSEGQSTQGGDGDGHVGNLDDFDDREVVQVPQRLLDAIADAIAHEIEDISASVAEVLAEDPKNVAASARKGDDDPERARKITSTVMPQAQEIRRVFDRQKDAKTSYLKGQERGRVDSRRLARVGAGSLNVFHRKEVMDSPDVAVGLLLDVSGSMNDYMEIVEQTAAVFAEGLSHKRGVNFAAWTYTGGSMHVQLTRICDRQLGKLCLGNIAHGGGTPSGAAIAGVKVLMARMPEKKKVIIHFTDGAPDNAHHVNRAVKAVRDAGTRVYAIGVGHMGGGLENQYGKGNWETVDRVSDLPQAVGRLLKRLDSFG